jgi:hypothetical protein
MEKHPLRGFNADPVEELRSLEREFNCFPDFDDLPVEPTDIVVGFVRGFYDFHAIDLGIVTLGEDIYHGKGLLVKGTPDPGFYILGINAHGAPYKKSRPGTAPDDNTVGIDDIGDGTDDERGAPELLNLALELADLPLVPDLLGLDVPLIRLDLTELLTELKVPGLHIGYTVEQVSA